MSGIFTTTMIMEMKVLTAVTLLLRLQLYTEYISKFDKALKALEEAKKKYSQFAELLRDFETETQDNFKKVIEVCKKLSGDTGDSLITPYRKLIREGELLKSCRKEKQMKMFFLFNDLLLYCISHPPGLTYKVVMRIPLDGMRVQSLNDPDMKHGFQIISTCKSFRLEASSAEECQQWIDAIKNAIRENSEVEATKQ
eukprot:Em0001g1745a